MYSHTDTKTTGIRDLVQEEDAARIIIESGCESQVIALLQAPDPDIAALGAFLCACMATDRRSHAALVSWGGVLRLAKGMALSSSPSFRFDAATALRLLGMYAATALWLSQALWKDWGLYICMCTCVCISVRIYMHSVLAGMWLTA
jgi:hypothetical protein